jgi:hypothetical protein
MSFGVRHVPLVRSPSQKMADGPMSDPPAGCDRCLRDKERTSREDAVPSFVSWLLIAAVSLAVIVVVVKERSHRVRAAELEARDARVTRGEASLKLLESRASELRTEIAQLEQQRDELIVVIPEGPRSERLRAKLSDKASSGGPSARAVAH